MTEAKIKYNRRTFIRSLIVWLLIIFAEIIHGILRAIALVPFVGEFRSSQIGVFTGSGMILVIAYLTIRWIGAKRSSELLLVGLIWLLLTVCFEFLFGRFVVGLAWEKVFAGYNMAAGGMMPLGLLILLLGPMIGVDGLEKCSGLPVCRYDADSMASTVGDRFSLIHSQNYLHTTPSGREQRFFFGVFQRV